MYILEVAVLVRVPPLSICVSATTYRYKLSPSALGFDKQVWSIVDVDNAQPG